MASARDVDKFTACLERLEARHGHFTAELSFGDVAILVAQVQLALRHPGNVGQSAGRARRFIERTIETLEASEPEVGRYLRMGFDPAHDVPAGGG